MVTDGASAKGEGAIGAGGDSGFLSAQGDVRRGDLDWLAAIGIREPDTHGGAADAHVDDFAQRLIFEFEFGGAHLSRLG